MTTATATRQRTADRPVDVPEFHDVCNSCGELFRVLIADPSDAPSRVPEYDATNPLCGECRR